MLLLRNFKASIILQQLLCPHCTHMAGQSWNLCCKMDTIGHTFKLNLLLGKTYCRNETKTLHICSWFAGCGMSTMLGMQFNSLCDMSAWYSFSGYGANGRNEAKKQLWYSSCFDLYYDLYEIHVRLFSISTLGLLRLFDCQCCVTVKS